MDTSRKIASVFPMLIGFGWYLAVGMVPTEGNELDGGKFFLLILFLVPIGAANFVFPRTNERSREQAHWFGLISGIAAVPLAIVVSFYFIAAKLHWKV